MEQKKTPCQRFNQLEVKNPYYIKKLKSKKPSKNSVNKWANRSDSCQKKNYKLPISKKNKNKNQHL